MISFIFLQMKVSPILSESEAADSNQMRLRDAGCLSPNCAPPARNRLRALALDSPTSWQDEVSVSLEFSSRIPRGEVHMEQSSLGVSHGGDTRTQARTHTLGKPQVFKGLLCSLPLPTGFGLCSCRKVHSDWGGAREQSEGAERLRQTQVRGKDKRGHAGLGPSSGMQQVGRLVPWQGQRGQAAQPVPTRAGAQSCSHPFPWAGEHSFTNSHDSQQPKWPNPSAS